MAERKSESGRRSGGSGPAGEPLRIGALATGGFEFAVAILAGVFAGWWVDRRLGSSPWLLLVGAFGGAGLGFYRLYRVLIAGQAGGSPRDDPPTSRG